MSLSSVRCHRVSAPLHTPFVTALRSTTMLETTVVELVDSDGVCGYGEAPQVWRVTGESVEGAAACISGPLFAVLKNRSVDDLEDLLADVASAVVGNWGAKSAVDGAVHDLAARRLGVSLPRLLGTSRLTVSTDVTLSAGDEATLRAAASARAAEGFGVLKLKVGADVLQDVARVMAVRDAVGPTVRLRVDANQGWSVKEAVAVIHALEDAGAELEFVEQPVAAADLRGMAAVTSRVDTPIMADESVFGLRDLSRLIEMGAADLVNVKLAKCGGLSVARAMLSLAAAHGVGTIVGSMMESAVGVSAAASLVAAVPTTYTSDLDAAWWLRTSPVQGGLTYDGATVRLPDVPGLGIEGLT